MSIKITSPLAGHTGRSVFGPTTVEFVDGVAEVEKISDGLKAYLEGRGYTVDATVEIPDGDPAEAWTVPQLRAWAGEHGVDLAGASKKPEVLARIADGPTVSGEQGQGDGGQDGEAA